MGGWGAVSAQDLHMRLPKGLASTSHKQRPVMNCYSPPQHSACLQWWNIVFHTEVYIPQLSHSWDGSSPGSITRSCRHATSHHRGVCHLTIGIDEALWPHPLWYNVTKLALGAAGGTHQTWWVGPAKCHCAINTDGPDTGDTLAICPVRREVGS